MLWSVPHPPPPTLWALLPSALQLPILWARPYHADTPHLVATPPSCGLPLSPSLCLPWGTCRVCGSKTTLPLTLPPTLESLHTCPSLRSQLSLKSPVLVACPPPAPSSGQASSVPETEMAPTRFTSVLQGFPPSGHLTSPPLPDLSPPWSRVGFPLGPQLHPLSLLPPPPHPCGSSPRPCASSACCTCAWGPCHAPHLASPLPTAGLLIPGN